MPAAHLSTAPSSLGERFRQLLIARQSKIRKLSESNRRFTPSTTSPERTELSMVCQGQYGLRQIHLRPIKANMAKLALSLGRINDVVLFI